MGKTWAKSGQDFAKAWARLWKSVGKAAGRQPARPSYHSLVTEDGMHRRAGWDGGQALVFFIAFAIIVILPPGVGVKIPPGVEGC